MDFFGKTAHKSKSQKNGYGKTDPAGVGIVFKSGPDDALFVKTLADGGPAALCGMIRVNDCLLKVDGEDVYSECTTEIPWPVS
jgi:C-terminal processing protease CtpA/Prc